MEVKYPLFSKEGLELLEYIYGKEIGQHTHSKLTKEILPKKVSKDKPRLPLDENDSFLITYGDTFVGGECSTLENLCSFSNDFLQDCGVNNVHILPFFPYSSDYYKVNEKMGSWKEVKKLGEKFKLAADIVLNHCSKSSEWFQSFLNDEEKYKDYFITVPKDTDLSMIVRPRALPLLSEFTKKKTNEKVYVWTTFSEDQVDLNFKCPEVLIEYIKILLFYVSMGIKVIRLDAIAYVWKEIGHPSLHHPKTHAIVKLFRTVVNEYFPEVLLLSETNVPCEENISYFGNTKDEAQMVYQFSLPPLTLHSFFKGDCSKLKEWAKIIPSYKTCTYFNFLASHDGVGVTPLKGYVEGKEKDELLQSIRDRGGFISEKSVKGGKIPYELNINYRDAICEQSLSDKERAKKFLASQAIMLSVVGVPAIYVHSLIGSGNDLQGVKQSNIFRRINREKLDYQTLKKELLTNGSIRNLVFSGFKTLLKARKSSKAFHPTSKQIILDVGNKAVFGIIREYDAREKIICLINTSKDKQKCIVKGLWSDFRKVTNIVDGRITVLEKEGENDFVVQVDTYDILWLRSQKRM